MAIEWRVVIEHCIMSLVIKLMEVTPMLFHKIESKLYSDEKVKNGIQMTPDNIPFIEMPGNRKVVSIIIKNMTYYSNIEMIVLIITLNDINQGGISQGFSFLKNIKFKEDEKIEIPFFLDDSQTKIIREMPVINVSGEVIFNCNNRRIRKPILNFQMKYQGSWLLIGPQKQV
jgi:hypothetical protein